MFKAYDEVKYNRIIAALILFLVLFYLNSVGAVWADGKDNTLGMLVDWMVRFVPASCAAIALFVNLREKSFTKSFLLSIAIDALIVISSFITIFIIFVIIDILDFLGIGGVIIGMFAYMSLYYTPVIVIIVL